jgi:SAM-dependent methyltransferase
MGFANETISNLILFDVWHHLQYPGSALSEFQRVLKPGGRLIIFDPAMSAFGRLIYGCFHHEPLGLNKTIEWFAPEGFEPEGAPYYAAQGNASRIFVGGSMLQRLRGWNVIEVKQLSALTYVASGGFSKPQLYPKSLYRFVRGIDGWLSKWPKLFATRLLIVLERT